MSIERILDRLEGVRRNGKRYEAKCPAHEDKSPSLSVEELGNKVLIHCFAGCDTSEVMRAINLEMKDLFTDSGMSISEKIAYKREKEKQKYKDIFNGEMLVIKLVRNDLTNGKQLTEADQQRLNEAIRRVKAIKEMRL